MPGPGSPTRIGERRKKALPDLPSEKPSPPLVRLWCLRILARLEGWRSGAIPSDTLRVDLAGRLTEALCLDLEMPAHPDDFLAAAEERMEELETRASTRDLAPPLTDNLGWLASRLDLDRHERLLLLFAVLMESDPHLETCASTLPSSHLGADRLPATLAVILDIPLAAVRRALARHGRLCRTGLIQVNDGMGRGGYGAEGLRSVISLIDGLAGNLSRPHDDPFEMLQAHFRHEPETPLGPEDFSHLGDTLDSLRDFLTRAIRQRERGVNILLHGAPGTGKTELSRLLGRLCGAETYAVTHQDEDGMVISGPDRLSSYRLAQAMLDTPEANLILFDELEDAFGVIAAENMLHQLFGTPRTHRGTSKGWINEMLETNPVPAIWIGNSIDAIDPAWLRRFDLVLEMPMPPVATRRRMIHAHLEPDDPLHEEWIGELSRITWLTPATIGRSLRYARLRGSDDTETFGRDMARHIDGLGRIEGREAVLGRRPEEPIPFDPSLLNTDPSATLLLERLRTDVSARICFHGPPGTGKTALAHAIAERSGRPLVVRHASDLLDKYVGQTERAIARMFQEADERDALLLVDEVESFLGQRDPGQRSWEVSMVNELLTRLERYRGTCIMTTNLIDRIDRAALRRFDLKVRFHPLDADRRWQLFCRILEQCGHTASEEYWMRIITLEGLTPGDFVSVLRGQLLLSDRLDPARFVKALEAELAIQRRAEGLVPEENDE